MRCYIVGAHSIGKTTLCRYISKKYQLPMVSEVARTVLAELEVGLGSIRTDIDLTNRFQSLVLQRQIETEKQLGDNFVSDRAFDTVCYTAEHATITSELISSVSFKEYVDWVKKGIVIFLRPNKILLKEDGIRETPSWESVLRIDGMVKFLLEQFGVKYLPVESVSMLERVRAVDFVLGRI